VTEGPYEAEDEGRRLRLAVMQVSRRRFLGGLGAAGIAAAFLAACGGSEDDPTPSTTAGSTGSATGTAASTGTAEAPGTPAAADAFPVTIEHEFGNTTVEQASTRVVAAGFNEVDFLLAFGVVPVGVRDFIGTYDETKRPWAMDLIGASNLVDIGGTEIDFERVAGLNPDLIMAVYAFLDDGAYTNLSGIAPTVTAPAGGATWQEQTRITGLALGQEQKAEELLGDIEARFAAVADEHPEFEGKTLAIVWGTGDPGAQFYLLPPTDLRAQFFYNMGFVPPEKTGEISAEEVNLLDQDVVAVFGWAEESMAGNPLFQTLAAVQEGRVTYIPWESDLAGALGFSSPLSIPYAIDIAAPLLALTLAGNG